MEHLEVGCMSSIFLNINAVVGHHLEDVAKDMISLADRLQVNVSCDYISLIAIPGDTVERVLGPIRKHDDYIRRHSN